MGWFKKEEKRLDPSIISGFLNKIQDIILTANEDGEIETINKEEMIDKYKNLGDFFEQKDNKELYEDMMKQIKEEGSFINDIEIIKNGQNIRLYVAAYYISSARKMFFYIKDVNQYLIREKELLREIDKQDGLLKSRDLFIANLSHEIKTPMNIIVGMIYFLKNTRVR